MINLIRNSLQNPAKTQYDRSAYKVRPSMHALRQGRLCLGSYCMESRCQLIRRDHV